MPNPSPTEALPVSLDPVSLGDAVAIAVHGDADDVAAGVLALAAASHDLARLSALALTRRLGDDAPDAVVHDGPTLVMALADAPAGAVVRFGEPSGDLSTVAEAGADGSWFLAGTDFPAGGVGALVTYALDECCSDLLTLEVLRWPVTA